MELLLIRVDQAVSGSLMCAGLGVQSLIGLLGWAGSPLGKWRIGLSDRRRLVSWHGSLHL
jgi:hypothetical protein